MFELSVCRFADDDLADARREHAPCGQMDFGAYVRSDRSQAAYRFGAFACCAPAGHVDLKQQFCGNGRLAMGCAANTGGGFDRCDVFARQETDLLRVRAAGHHDCAIFTRCARVSSPARPVAIARTVVSTATTPAIPMQITADDPMRCGMLRRLMAVISRVCRSDLNGYSLAGRQGRGDRQATRAQRRKCRARYGKYESDRKSGEIEIPRHRRRWANQTI